MAIVSVVIPTYNRADVLHRAIDSVLDQTYDDFEIIVVDDGSTDNTEDVVTSYSDNRIKYVSFGSNKGANVARNEGIRKANGKYIAFLDSDDEYCEDYLQKIIAEIKESSPDCIGTYASRMWISNGDLMNVTKADYDVFYNDIVDQNSIGGFSNVAFKRYLFEEVEFLDEAMPSSQDYEFFLRSLEETDGYISGVPDAFIKYSLHNGEQIGEDIERQVEGTKKLLERHNGILSQKGKSNQYYQLGLEYGRNENIKEARRQFWKAISIYPKSWMSWLYLLLLLFGNRGFGIGEKSKFVLNKRLNR